MKKLLRFNGHFFHQAEALPLSREDLAVLAEAADQDWRHVAPTIFGTLLTRALDPVERHRLGAEYTPQEYVERVVRQTVEVPIRDRWTPVQAEVAQLREKGRKRDREAAVARLREFHAWLRGLRFLDPACGSGNFLYVTLHAVKRVELEVLREIEEITDHPELGIEEVGPWQFHGIEVKPWAREIAELTLWIGYHQFWLEHHKGVNPPEPVLQDTGTLELRDAVLAWDGEPVEDPSRSRPDPTPRIPHPVTGKLVPDPNARLPYLVYKNPRQAEWPQADFIIGNPPYMGQFKMREAFGDGYVDALRSAYPHVSDTADYVMFWWYRASDQVAHSRTVRSGLITTNTLVQAQNRTVVESATKAGARVVWAVADHPWVDESGAADVRVAMTVVAKAPASATLVKVDEKGRISYEFQAESMNADLTAHADVATASSIPLRANEGLASPGYKLHGSGFILSSAEFSLIPANEAVNQAVVKPLLNGRDLNSHARGVFVIDFGLMTEAEARAFPTLFDLVRARVKPERDANKRQSYAQFWWRFGEPRRELRDAQHGLSRYIVTAETSKHRTFTFLHSSVAPDNTLVCIATEDGFYMGILSSTIHVEWALVAGGRMGIGNDPRYNKTRCFNPFPFPDSPLELRERISEVAERLDRHRKDALARDERVALTGMYNVVEKLRSGEALTPKERDIHTLAACGVLKDLHDELDRLVAEAYGWPWPMEREEILERLVALHDERVEEEKQGKVRWLRPDYQIPRFGKVAAEARPAPELALPEPEAKPAPPEKRAWPGTVQEQIAALKALVSTRPAAPDEAASAFAGARAELVRGYLEALVSTGEVRAVAEGRYEAVAEPL